MQWFQARVSFDRIYVWNVATATFCYDANGNMILFQSVGEAESYAADRERARY